jgi:L-rhamnose mutarotase
LTVVGYLEVHPDSATAFAKLGTYEVNAKWAKWFEDVIVNLADSQGNLMKLDEVWHLD